MSETPAVEVARDVLDGILDVLDLDADITDGEGEDGRRVFILEGPDATLFGQGHVLDALQYLVNRMAQKKCHEGDGLPVSLDADGYRARRRQELTETASRLAQEVRETGESVSAGKLTPYERRLVHMALAEEEGVATRSEGEGDDRRLRVVPA